jgi:hypothetical protein
MNAVIAKYILLKDATPLSGGALANLSVILQRVYVQPTAVQKKNAFAIHRVIAKAYQNFVEFNGRAALVQAFKSAYDAGVAAAAATLQGGARTVAMMRRKTGIITKRRPHAGPSVVTGIVPLFLASRALQGMTLEREAHPFECSERLLQILKGWMAPASLDRIYATLPGGIPPPLFKAFYYEAVAYFVFFVLPSLENFPSFHPLFAGLDLDNVKELGFILQRQILGDTKEKRAVEEELVLFLGHILKTLPRDVRGDDAPVYRLALFAIREQESFLRKVETASRPRTASGTRKRSRTRSRSASKTRRASKLRRKGSRSRSRSGTAAPTEMEVAA